MTIARSNVTIRGITARNCLISMFSAGFRTGKDAEHVVFEDCHSFNCSRGFVIMGRHMRLLRCRAENVGCGVLVNGLQVGIEEGVFFHGPRDDFMVPMLDPQEETGIEVYHPAGEEIHIRGNVIKGFMFCGIFIKCLPGVFTLERNTLVDNTIGIGWSPDAGKRVIARDNIMYGGAMGIQGQVRNQAIVMLQADGNILWPALWGGDGAMRENLDYLNSTGKGNIFADPYFAVPEANDFRLLPDSPCALRSGTGRQVGALGVVPTDFRDKFPPLLVLNEQPALVAVNGEVDALPLFVASRRDFTMRVHAHDAVGKVVQMRLRIGDEPWGDPLPYAENVPVKLPADAGVFTVCVRAVDDAGNWSEPAAIRVRVAVAAPRLVEKPMIRTNQNGVVISFRTDVACLGSGEFGFDQNCGTPLLSNGGKKDSVSCEHVLGALSGTQDSNRQCYFRIRLTNHDGKTVHEFSGVFNFNGRPQPLYVDPTGVDVESGGTTAHPWRSLQYAVDRALPGDCVTALPGLYPEGAQITRGGIEGAPLVIQAKEKWTTVVDGRNQVRGNALIHVMNASHVEIAGLELRWFGNRSNCAIRLNNAPHITVRECEIWNELRWGEGRLGGIGIVADKSQALVLEKCLLFRLDYAMRLSDSPHARIVHNTFRAFSHGGLTFEGSSVKGTIVRNNAINYPGNYVYEIHVSDPKDMQTFDSNYNNLGSRIRDEYWRDEPGVLPNLPPAVGSSKTVALYKQSEATCLKPGKEDESAPDGKKDKGWKGRVMSRCKWVPDATTPPEEQAKNLPYFTIATFEDWQAFSGQDKNSIWVDPRQRDTLEFDFRLLPDSPNIGTGENGATIGAMPVYQPEKDGKSAD